MRAQLDRGKPAGGGVIWIRLGLGALVATGTLVACTYDFDAPFAGGGGAAATAGLGGSAASTSSSDATSGSTTTSSTTTTTTTTSSTTTSSSTTTTTTTTVSTGPDPITIECGGECTFTPGQGGCCWDEFELHSPPRAECFTSILPSSSDCRTQSGVSGRESRIQCQEPSTCGGAHCCATYVANPGYYPDVACSATCSAPNVRLCDPDAESPCAEGLSCQPVTGLPPGYFTCLVGPPGVGGGGGGTGGG